MQRPIADGLSCSGAGQPFARDPGRDARWNVQAPDGSKGLMISMGRPMDGSASPRITPSSLTKAKLLPSPSTMPGSSICMIFVTVPVY